MAAQQKLQLRNTRAEMLSAITPWREIGPLRGGPHADWRTPVQAKAVAIPKASTTKYDNEQPSFLP